MFVTEKVFILEQITDHRHESLPKISHKLSTISNIFIRLCIQHFRDCLNHMTLKIQRPGGFGWKAIICTINIYLRARDVTFKIAKRYNNKDIHLTIGGGLCLGKWLKNWVGPGFIYVFQVMYPKCSRASRVPRLAWYRFKRPTWKSPLSTTLLSHKEL